MAVTDPADNPREGAMLDLRLGGRRTPRMASRCARARVLRHTDGVFVNSGPMETGWPCIAGRPWCWPWARRSSSSPRTSRRATTRPFRSAWHRPARTRLLCVKAKNHFRAAAAVPAHRGYRCAGAGDAGFAPGPDACNDPAFFDLHGIDTARTRLLCVKAKNHFRAAFAGAGIVDIDAPGPAYWIARAQADGWRGGRR